MRNLLILFILVFSFALSYSQDVVNINASNNPINMTIDTLTNADSTEVIIRRWPYNPDYKFDLNTQVSFDSISGTATGSMQVLASQFTSGPFLPVDTVALGTDYDGFYNLTDLNYNSLMFLFIQTGTAVSTIDLAARMHRKKN